MKYVPTAISVMNTHMRGSVSRKSSLFTAQEGKGYDGCIQVVGMLGVKEGMAPNDKAKQKESD